MWIEKNILKPSTFNKQKKLFKYLLFPSWELLWNFPKCRFTKSLFQRADYSKVVPFVLFASFNYVRCFSFFYSPKFYQRKIVIKNSAFFTITLIYTRNNVYIKLLCRFFRVSLPYHEIIMRNESVWKNRIHFAYNLLKSSNKTRNDIICML